MLREMKQCAEVLDWRQSDEVSNGSMDVIEWCESDKLSNDRFSGPN